MINMELAKARGLSAPEIKGIKLLQKIRYSWHTYIGTLVSSCPDGKLIKKANEVATELEFGLQKLWGFPLDYDWHRFWEIPGCACPKMDNEDRYPYGNYIINQKCRIHGEDNAKQDTTT